MVSAIGQGTQYKGFRVSRALTLFHIRIDIGYSDGYGNFSDVSVLKRVIDEIVKSEFHPERLEELRKAYMAEVNELRAIRNVIEDAYEALWALSLAGALADEDSHLNRAMAQNEKEATRVEQEILELKRAALCVASVERAVSEKDIPF